MIKNNHNILFLLIVAIFFSTANNSIAQKNVKPKKKAKTYLTFEYYKKTDGSKLLFAKLKTKINKKFVPVVSAVISFTIETDSSTINLKNINTNQEGIAKYYIPKGTKLPTNNEGYTTFKVTYHGNDFYKPKKKKLNLKDIFFHVDFEIFDSIKTINVYADDFVKESESGINKLKIGVFVQRMFSQLKVAEGILKNGKCSIEFPTDLPGDSIGNLIVFTKIEDDDDYGNVENIQTIKWGIPVTEKESFKSSFSGGSYIAFWIISLFVVLIIYLITKKLKISDDF